MTSRLYRYSLRHQIFLSCSLRSTRRPQRARIRDITAPRWPGCRSCHECPRTTDLRVHLLCLQRFCGTCYQSRAFRQREIYSRTHVKPAIQHGADLFGLRASGNIYSRIGNPTVVRHPSPRLEPLVPVLWSLFLKKLTHAPRTSLRSASPHSKAVSQPLQLPVARRPNSWPSATSRVQVTTSCLRHISMAG